MKRFVTAVVGILLFTGAALGGVWLLTGLGDGAPGRTAEPAAAPPPASAATPPVPFQPSPSVAAPPAPPNVYGPPRVEPPKGSWEAVPVVARASALGPLGGAVGRGLIELQPRLAACFDEDTQARFGQEAYSRVKDAEPMDDQGATILVLQIETGGNDATIVDAPVETRGGASDGLIACAQRVLRGQRFAVPGGQGGQKYRMLHSLSR